jgi:hypothetical protein
MVRRALSSCAPNNIDTKAKCHNLKKFTCEGTLRQVAICPRSLPSYDPIPPHLYTLYMCMLYTVLIHKGKGES